MRAVAERFGADPEQLLDGPREIADRDSGDRRGASRGVAREVAARLDQVQPAVAAHHLVVRQVVVHVREVDVEDLVAQERERLERVERVQRDHADEVPMRRHRVHRAVEGGQGVVPEEEAESRVVARPPLLVEGPEPVEPEGGPLAGAHADLEREDLGRELALLLEVAQERPEVRDRVHDCFGTARVRAPAGKSLLEPTARGGLPVRDPLPEEPVEPPDHAVADGRPLLEDRRTVRLAVRRVGDSAKGTGQRLAQPCGLDAAEIDRKLGQRQRPAGAVRGPPDGDGLAKVGTVLDPVEVNAEARQDARVPVAGRDEPEEGPDDLGGPRFHGAGPGPGRAPCGSRG